MGSCNASCSAMSFLQLFLDFDGSVFTGSESCFLEFDALDTGEVFLSSFVVILFSFIIPPIYLTTWNAGVDIICQLLQGFTRVWLASREQIQ